MYDPKSLHAEQFIDNDEVLASLEYADRYCNDPAEIDRIIEKNRRRDPSSGSWRQPTYRAKPAIGTVSGFYDT